MTIWIQYFEGWWWFQVEEINLKAKFEFVHELLSFTAAFLADEGLRAIIEVKLEDNERINKVVEETKLI